jgi:tape measure domain-containing protein
MAERVARVKIQATADLKGFDEASKSLRELQKAVGPADAEIAKVRQEILNFAQASKQSEAVISAQINALKQLKQQAAIGGSVYKDLGTDVERLKRSLSDAGVGMQGTARAIGDVGRATQSTQAYINNQAKSFEAMRKQANDTINTLQNLGRQADQLKNKGGGINFFSSGPARGGGGVFEIGRKGLADVQAYAALVKRLQDQAQTATGKVARLSEGMFALGATGIGLKSVVDSLGGVSGALESVSSFTGRTAGAFAQLGAGTPQWASAIKGGLNEISLLLNQPASGIANWSQSLAGVQAKLTTLSVPLEAFNNAIVAIGPEGAAAAGVVAVAFAGLQDAIGRAFKEGEKDATQALQGITDETQQLLRKLAELSQAFRGAASMNELRALQGGAQARFNETPAGTDASRRAANTIANAEARIRIEAQAQADVLEAARQKYRGAAQDVTSLGERLTYLNQAMKLVDQSTSEGSIEYAKFASEADRVKQQIDKLASSYRTVAQAAKEAGQAQGIYANQSTVANYFNRAAVRRNEDIARAAREALAAPQTLALPAAGQTSFSGNFNEALGIGGGARLGSGRGEMPFQMGSDPASRQRFMGAQRSEAEINAATGALQREAEATRQAASAANSAESELMQLYRAMQALAQSQVDKKTQQTAFGYRELAQEIDRVGRASDGSLNSLRQQRELWEQLYNAVERTDPAYRQAAQNIQRIDRQLERSQLGGMQGKVGYIAQGIGAAASAGIFGGPEGLLGGLGGGIAGALLGGPAGFAAGAFTGSSIGAYAGMGRQQLGGFADYAAELQKQQIALRDVVASAAEYERALRVASDVSNQFNVPIGEATRGLTQLSASVIGAGGKVADAEVVYKNITAAIKATGGGAEQVQGAMTALSQIFSKGKVSAEELSGQLGERLPGAVTLFAKATGRSLPQLQKDLEQGVVGLNDVMKFVVSLGDKYTATAEKIAASDADAGQRFQKTLADFRAAIGKELAPLGADLQDAFSSFLKDITPALISTAKSLAGGIKAIIDNAGQIGNLIKFAAQMGAIHLAIKAIIAVRPAMVATFAAFQLGGAQAAASAALATPKIAALGMALRSLSLIGIITVGVNVITRGLDQIRQVRTEIESLREYSPNAAFAGATRETVQSVVDQANKDLGKFNKELQTLQQGYWKTLIPGATLFGAGPGDFQTQKKLLEIRVARAQKTINELDPLKFPTQVEVQREELRKLQQELTKFQDPASGKDGSKEAADKAKREAEQLAAEQQRRDEALARARIELDNTVFRNQLELVKRRYDYEQERIRQQRDIWAGTFEGVRNESARAAVALLNRLDEIRNRVRDANLAVQQAEQNVRSTTRAEAVTSQGLSGRTASAVGLGASFSAQQLQTAAREASRFTGVAKMCAESVKAFYKSLGISLPGVTAWADTVRKAGTVMRDWSKLQPGDIVATGSPGDTPHVGVYTGGKNVFHQSRNRGLSVGNFPDLDYFKSGYFVRPSSAASAGGMRGPRAVQARRDIRAEGNVGIAQAELNQARTLASAEGSQVNMLLQGEAIRYAQERTQGLRDQAKAMEDGNTILRKRMELEAQGMRPELIEAQIKILEIERERAAKIEQINENIAKFQGDPEAVAGFRAELEATNAAYDRQITAINALAQVQTAAGAALAGRIGQLRAELAELASFEKILVSISQTIETGLSTAISSAVSSLASGSANIKQIIGELFASIGKAFIDLAAQIIAKQLVIIALNSIAKIFNAGAAPSGSQLNIADALKYSNFATGGVMTNVGPLPLKRYAAGGVANSPQVAMFGERGPEAYVPLPDGRSIPVKMRGDARSDALSRYQPVPGGAQAGPDGQLMAEGGAAVAGGGIIDVRYTVERINNVEYVTADQFRNGMRQAAKEGAARGEQQTLRRLQTSASTRKRVGV